MSREPKKTCSAEEDNKSFIECAEFVLPWLSPRELASISLTCKTLNSLSKSITIRRVSDASRNLEKNPIPFINTIDSEPYSYFIYTFSQIFSSPCLSQSWGTNPKRIVSSSVSLMKFGSNVTSLMSDSTSGCVCKNCSEDTNGDIRCPCSKLKPLSLSNMGSDSSELGLMTECGPSCDCGVECKNRLPQRGVSVQVRIGKDARKGWSLYSAQFVPRGEFVCEYAGELLTTQEARKRQKKYDDIASTSQFGSALLVVREHLPSGNACLRVNIDATRVGNAARFINHSCDGGNLSTVLVRGSGALFPRLCFFASRDILDGEELAFSYGEPMLKQNRLKCFCGSSCCLGALPSEET
ncbi:hypothetical protein C5167_033882 [Papaver somniferum]|uniref:SET domain-containing protein n=1 Tax=Papaver somniferum TaxID=3469 RepID=A0A4Y7KBI4_PAPSO|nr:histone-lysine N-methyltransferase SUVR3-like [Papaver somniferum]RZC70723.1 hypothetical protein C5167_033882 [Papaver somniferum]